MGFIVIRSRSDDTEDSALSWGRDRYIPWERVETRCLPVICLHSWIRRVPFPFLYEINTPASHAIFRPFTF